MVDCGKGQGKVKGRSRHGQDKFKTRSRYGPGKFMSRSRRGFSKVKACLKRGQGKINLRFGQSNNNHKHNCNLMGFDTININLVLSNEMVILLQP